jgi:hypothetical protein
LLLSRTGSTRFCLRLFGTRFVGVVEGALCSHSQLSSFRTTPRRIDPLAPAAPLAINGRPLQFARFVVPRRPFAVFLVLPFVVLYGLKVSVGFTAFVIAAALAWLVLMAFAGARVVLEDGGVRIVTAFADRIVPFGAIAHLSIEVLSPLGTPLPVTVLRLAMRDASRMRLTYEETAPGSAELLSAWVAEAARAAPPSTPRRSRPQVRFPPPRWPDRPSTARSFKGVRAVRWPPPRSPSHKSACQPSPRA